MLALCFTGCAPRIPAPSDAHILATEAPEGVIPAPVLPPLIPPPPQPQVRAETYNVVVHNLPAVDVLFALARDAKINLDVHPGISGNVSLNAIDQTLEQILTRIAKQVDMRYEMDGKTLIVMPDAPFLRHYKVDYVNMTRDTSTTVNVATQIATTGSGDMGDGGGNQGGGATNNSSTTEVKNAANNRFWETLLENIRDILRETDKLFPSTSTANETGGEGAAASAAPRMTYREAASVIAHPETGVVTVRATQRQHEKIREFLDQVMVSAKRQVLIEATVVEVQLSDQYQQGIDWEALKDDASGFFLSQQGAGTSAALVPAAAGLVNPSLFLLSYSSANFSATVTLLQNFGNVKVLSSPRLSVLNNQTAVLKVVDNRVFFTTEVTVTPATTTTAPLVTVNTILKTVPVGFVMNVTPQINASDVVTLNVRPAISRIVGFVNDPNPALADANVISQIPEIQTREMESVLRIPSGHTAMMGGLMQDSIDHKKDTLPGLDRVPVLSNLFSFRDEKNVKSELVIFLRPLVMTEDQPQNTIGGIALPDSEFFSRPGGLGAASPLSQREPIP